MDLIRTRIWFIALACLGLLSYAPHIEAKSSREHRAITAGLLKGESGMISRIIDGDSFILDTGLKVQLAGIAAPKPGRKNENTGRTSPAWPLAETAKKHLQVLAEGQTVQLYYGRGTKKTDRRDRYGRALAQVYLTAPDGRAVTWLQKSMVTAGMARVYPWPGQIMDVQSLYEAERAARAENRGIWQHRKTRGFYDLRTPEPHKLAQMVDSVQIIEGIVVKTAKVYDRIYLNFGADYRSDFTIAIEKKYWKTFEKSGIDPMDLQGAKVRVRGFIELYGGPIIWLRDPRRLEVLD